MICLFDGLSVSVANPVAGAAINLNRTALAGVLVKDADGGTVPADRYTASEVELAAGVLHWANPLATTGHATPWTVHHVIVLPEDLSWTDEFGWRPVGVSTAYTLTGALVLEETAKQAGRPVSLAGSQNQAWLSRADLLRLQAWAANPVAHYTLELPARASLTVAFTEEAIEATPLFVPVPPTASDLYFATLKFITV